MSSPAPALAQSHMRDARLFLGLAYIPCLILVFVEIWSLLSRTDHAPLTDPTWGVVRLMALCSWTTLLVASFWKLISAQRAGFSSQSSSRVGLMLSLNTALLAALSMASGVLSGFMGKSGLGALVAIPVICVACPMLLRLIVRGDRKATPGRRSAYILGLAQLWLAYGLINARLSQGEFLSFFDAEWERNYAPGKSHCYYVDNWDQGGLYFPPTTEFRCLVWLVPWSVASALACYLLAKWLRSTGKCKTALCCTAASAFCAGFFLVLMVNLLPFDRSATRFATLAAAAAAVAGIVLGSLSAGWWKGERVTWRHRAALAAPLIALLCAAAIPVGGITAAALLPLKPDEPQRIWIWHLPEWVRRPVTSTYIWLRPKCRDNLVTWGLLPVDVVKAQALTSGQNFKLWAAWADRDPGALSVALGVGETDRPAAPITAYDFSAGYLIGKIGDENAIRQRLSGSYSEPLTAGLAFGLVGREISPYTDALIARFERFADPKAFVWLNDFLKNAPEQVKPHLQRYIDNPTPLNLTRLQALPDLWRKADRDCDLTLKAMQSSSVALRKFALENLLWHPSRAKAKHLLLTVLLDAMEGRNANTDANEQRQAALACGDLFEMYGLSVGYQRSAGAPVLPLTPKESAEIAALIQRVRSTQSQATPASRPSR